MTQPRKRATIRELAARTGLSPAAVSYALRGLQVSPETAERVRLAAVEIGYEADPIARALRGGATGVVGLLVSSLADFWIQELVRAVQSQLRASGRHTIVADSDGDVASELPLVQRLADQRVDGLVVVPLGAPSEAIARIAAAVPTVTIGNELTGVPVAGRVVFDTARGVAETLRHLAGQGHRRVAILSWAVEASPGERAERAARAHAVELGIECEIVPCAYSLNGSRPLAVEVLRRRRRRPTAIFCLSDSIAYGVYAACAELGLAIPGDVAVAGFDDHPMSRLLAPPLTSTSWGVERVAATAVRFLQAAIDGAAGEQREVIAPELTRRASTASLIRSRRAERLA